MCPKISFELANRIRVLSLLTGVIYILTALSFPSVVKSAVQSGKNKIDMDGVTETTVYVWDSQLLIDQSKIDSTFWNRFLAHRINRLMLSLDGGQIRSLAFKDCKTDLVNFINHAGKRGIKVELLLGEPLWILPRYRQDLLEIIQLLKDLPFTGLHLDLEPNQLDQNRYDNRYLLAQLMHTLQSVKRISPWPVGLSIHYRYLDPKKNELCLGCALSNLNIAEIILMIYVANPVRVAELALPILTRFPTISFAIAQSVEPILSVKESHATQGNKQFSIKMAKLQAAMTPMANFTTIAIQSWEDLIRLKP